jgi:hypothetical protein
MLVNLLARTDGIVEAVHVVCPSETPLAGRVVPLAPRDVCLADALVTGGRAIGGVPVDLLAASGDADSVLFVGHEPEFVDIATGHPTHRWVVGHGWWGGVASQPTRIPEPASELPFGPYVAAALAVGEVYLRARLPQHVNPADGTYGWDCWAQTLAEHPVPGAPADLLGVNLGGVALAGVGAVGSTWVHALWATPHLTGDVTLADADVDGVTTTNLNRCPLFGRGSLHRGKAMEAARIAEDSAITWHPYQDRLEACLPPRLQVLVSAVDSNRARENLQSRYAPAMLSGSTRDLRAEVLRAGPPGTGACLRCYNPPESVTGDDELRVQTRRGGPQGIQQLARDTGVTEAEVHRWLDRGQCDEVGARLLASLRHSATSQTPARFAVGFTSVMAGVLLAAETIKVTLGQDLQPGQVGINNATVQFLKPSSMINAAGPLGRDPQCPACVPTDTASQIWQRRIDQWFGV